MSSMPAASDSGVRDVAQTDIAAAVFETPAVIVGADVDGLGIARSFGMANVPAIMVDTDPRRPGMHSRYVRPNLVSALCGPGLIEGLLELGRRIKGQAPLFLTTDQQVQAVSEHRQRLLGAFRFRLPAHDRICELLHKRGFQQFAEGNGFPVPRAVSVCGEADLSNLGKIQYPAVIKPGDKRLFFGGRVFRARKVRSQREAEDICRAVPADAQDLVIQEWVEGGEDDVYFCLQYRGEDGATIRSFCGRKIRCWPPETGSTASCTAAPEAGGALESMTKAFFDRAGVVGMCSMEYKRDSRNGQFTMIEPTIGRTDWQEEVATINGVNIPLAAYRYEMGTLLPQVQRTLRPQIWMFPPSYWRSVQASRSFQRSRPPAAKATDPFLNAADPVPGIFFALECIRKIFGKARWQEFIAAMRQPAPRRREARGRVASTSSLPSRKTGSTM